MTVQTTITVMDSMPEPVVRPQHNRLLSRTLIEEIPQLVTDLSCYAFMTVIAHCFTVSQFFQVRLLCMYFC